MQHANTDLKSRIGRNRISVVRMDHSSGKTHPFFCRTASRVDTGDRLNPTRGEADSLAPQRRLDGTRKKRVG